MTDSPYKLKTNSNMPEEYFDALKEDGHLLAVDDDGSIKDILYYNKDENRIVCIGQITGLNLFTTHGYAIRYLLTTPKRGKQTSKKITK